MTELVVEPIEEPTNEWETDLDANVILPLQSESAEEPTLGNLQASTASASEPQRKPLGESTTENPAAVESEIEAKLEPDSVPKIVRLIGLPAGEEPSSFIDPSDQEPYFSEEAVSSSITFGLPKTSQNRESIRNELIVSPKHVVEATPKSAVVGLISSQDSVETRPSLGYSPFGVKIHPLEREADEPTVPKPLPNRQRFQWD